MIRFHKLFNNVKNYNTPKKSDEGNYKIGTIYYCTTAIPVRDILCIRNAPDSYKGEPESIITFRVKNPKDNCTTAMEYRLSGSVKQWNDAIKRAQEGNDLSSIDFKG